MIELETLPFVSCHEKVIVEVIHFHIKIAVRKASFLCKYRLKHVPKIFSNFTLQELFTNKDFCIETRLRNILEIANVVRPF